jgi:hypothetical protein
MMKAIQILALCCLTFGSAFVYAGCGGGPSIVPDKPSPINMGDSIRLVLQPDGTTCPTISNYQWYKDDSLIPGATTKVFVARHTGVYKVTYIESGWPLDSAFFSLVVNPVGISDIAKTAVKIFPNPTSGVINIEHLEQYIGSTLEISDVMGRKITTQEITQSNITYHFGNQPKGIFIVRIMNNGAAIIRKILSQ